MSRRRGSCFRVLVREAGMLWAPIVAAVSEAEALAIAAFLKPDAKILGVVETHPANAHRGDDAFAARRGIALDIERARAAA